MEQLRGEHEALTAELTRRDAELQELAARRDADAAQLARLEGRPLLPLLLQSDCLWQRAECAYAERRVPRVGVLWLVLTVGECCAGLQREVEDLSATLESERAAAAAERKRRRSNERPLALDKGLRAAERRASELQAEVQCPAICPCSSWDILL